MTNPGRLKAPRRPKRSASQMIVAGLLALAVVASLFLIFSDSVQLLRVGLVIALWAATLGAIAMTKYRRESALDKAKVNDLQTVYELQLEREITARREYELTVEKRVRSEVRADSEELAALRAELSALRQNLEVLFDGAMPTERTALRADSTRVQELARGAYGSYQPAASGLYIPGSGGGQSSSTGSRAYGHGHSGFASPEDDPVTAETTIVPGDYDQEAAPEQGSTQDRNEQGSFTVDGYPRESTEADDAEPRTDPRMQAVRREDLEPQETEAVQEAEPELRVAEEVGAQEPASEEFVAEEIVAEEVVAEETAEADSAPQRTSRRSRRALESEEHESSGAHSSGLTVAQIMANMQADPSRQSTGGRRRRAE
ncbi:DUF6779 domain-containing protein [Rhodococcus sp. NPDC058521]|uniref:DUF6779 domain-containing protein n=1 Tax=Rhodococcus sp. NPDC058521 TaxID=3346536 RepID=UPI00365347EF